MSDIIAGLLQSGGPYAASAVLLFVLVFLGKRWRADLISQRNAWRDRFDEERANRDELQEQIRESKDRDMEAVGQLRKAVEQMLHAMPRSWGLRTQKKEKKPPRSEPINQNER